MSLRHDKYKEIFFNKTSVFKCFSLIIEKIITYMSDYKRIRELIKHLGISANALSKVLELKSPQIFYDIKSGKCGISKDLAMKIQEKYLNINAAWLLTGEGQMLKENRKNVIGNVIPENDNYTTLENGNVTGEVADLIKLLENKDHQINNAMIQIDKVLQLLENKDTQIDRLMSIFETKNNKK